MENGGPSQREEVFRFAYGGPRAFAMVLCLPTWGGEARVNEEISAGGPLEGQRTGRRTFKEGRRNPGTSSGGWPLRGGGGLCQRGGGKKGYPKMCGRKYG